VKSFEQPPHDVAPGDGHHREGESYARIVDACLRKAAKLLIFSLVFAAK
jgi:hypothetical protein